MPFLAPVPEAVLEWLTKIVTFELYLKRGVDPSDSSIAFVKEQYDGPTGALTELKEAADAQAGLFDLPLNDTRDTSARTKAGPLVYAEASPYVSFDIQRADGRDDDANGSGR